jgi:protein involved in polysaccharide export with SLBB domain
MLATSKTFATLPRKHASLCLLATTSFLLFASAAEATGPQAGDIVTGAVPANTLSPSVDGKSVAKPEASSAAGEELMIGDKVQVSFFEQFDLGHGADAGLTADARTFYQRLDLTGEHVVGADGAISIPLIGRFIVSGMTPEEGEAQIMDAYRSVMGREGQVDIAIMDRKPVFVTGIVKAPGSFRFEPGMVVLQAVALAGGYDRGAEAASRLLDAQRERERHTQAVDRLERLIAKRIRLVKQSNAPVEDQPNPEKRSDAGDAIAPNRAMESEMGLLDAELAANSGTDVLQQARLANASGQVDSLKKILDLVAQQIDVRSERLRVLQQMQGRGFSTLEILWNAQKDVSDLQMQQERLTAELASADQNVVQTQAEGAKLISDRHLDIERQIAAVDEEIDQQKTVIDTSEKMIAALETATSGARLGTPLKVTIMRRTPAKAEIIDADETTDLLPGDVVKVDADIGDASQAGTL